MFTQCGCLRPESIEEHAACRLFFWLLVYCICICRFFAVVCFFTDVLIKMKDQISPIQIFATSSSIDPKTLPSDPFLQNICNRIKHIQSSNLEKDHSRISRQETIREQPDGKDDSLNEMTSSFSFFSINSSQIDKRLDNSAPSSAKKAMSESNKSVDLHLNRHDTIIIPESSLNSSSTLSDVSLSPKTSAKDDCKSKSSKYQELRLPTFKPALLRSPTPSKYGLLFL